MIKDISDQTQLKEKHIWGYGLGNFGYGIIFQIMATYFVFYATAVLGLSGTLVGLIIGIGVVWDAVSDPMMGYISDFTISKKFGRRHLYLWVGGISMVITNLVLWNLNPNMPDWLLLVIMALMLLLIKTATTIYGTPYSALGAEMTHDHAERTKVQSVRMGFFMLGIFFATAGGMLVFFRSTPAYPMGQLNPMGYQIMGIVTSIIVLGTSLISIFSTQHLIPKLNLRVVENSNAGIKNFFKLLFDAYRHDDLRAVVIGYLFTNLAAALLSNIGLLVYTYTFKMHNTDIAIIAGGQLLVAVLSQPFWLWRNKHQDKIVSIRQGLMLSMTASVYFVGCVFLQKYVAINLWVLTPFVLLAGFGSGGLFTLPQAMVADAVDENALNTGTRQEGVYYGTLTLTYKLSQSVAILMIGILVDFLGFDSKLSTQSLFTTTSLGLLLSLGSLLAFIFAFFSYQKYKITRKRLHEIHEGLLARDKTL
ncbi:MAG: MFS transporter [Clostridia bacterium]